MTQVLGTKLGIESKLWKFCHNFPLQLPSDNLIKQFFPFIYLVSLHRIEIDGRDYETTWLCNQSIMKIKNKRQYLYVGILIHYYSAKQTNAKK